MHDIYLNASVRCKSWYLMSIVCVRPHTSHAGKLALSGLLQFVEPGTAAQVFFGCIISFASFGMQLWLRPYREPEANTLKMLVDTQIFLTFLLSFILRVLPSDDVASLEPLQPVFYGWVLALSLLVLCVAALALTVAQIQRRWRLGLLLSTPSQELELPADGFTMPADPAATALGLVGEGGSDHGDERATTDGDGLAEIWRPPVPATMGLCVEGQVEDDGAQQLQLLGGSE